MKILKSQDRQQELRIDWTQKPEATRKTVTDALQSMNLFEMKKKDGSAQWYYMYRKVCDIVDGQDTCPWCYSSTTRLKKAAKSLSQHEKYGKHSLIACKSNHFSTLEDLATDVCRRIEHHSTDPANVMPLIQGMFLPVTKENKDHHRQVLEKLIEILALNNALPNSRPTSLCNDNDGHNDSIDQISEVLIIDDWTCLNHAKIENSGSEFRADTSTGSILKKKKIQLTSQSNTDKRLHSATGSSYSAKQQDRLYSKPLQSQDDASVSSDASLIRKVVESQDDASVSSDASLIRKVVESQDDASVSSDASLIRKVVESQDDASVSSDASLILKVVESSDPDEQLSFDCMYADIFIDDDELTGSKQERLIVTPRNGDRDIVERRSAANASHERTESSDDSIIRNVVEPCDSEVEEVHVLKGDMELFDWDNCKTKMQSWSYNDFRNIIDERGMQVAEQGSEKSLVALRHLRVGTVVEDHAAFTAYYDEQGGRAGTTEQYNCEILWIDYPDLNKPQKSQKRHNKVGFIVTTKRIEKGETLEWLCKRRGRDKEPNIMQSILLSMQGDVNHGRKPFGLDAYVNLWRLHMPSPKRQQVTIASIPFETTNFGSSIRPFLHQATIDLLLMKDITDWLDIDANNSFVIHLALAMNKNPLALHTMFARNCTRKASQNSAWTSDVLDAVYPSSLNIEIVILVKQEGGNTYTRKIYGSGETPESSVVLIRDGMDYSWLEDDRIHAVNIQQFQHTCQYEDCVKWETLTTKSVFIRGCDNSKNEAPAHWKETVWEAACKKVGLQSSHTGKWKTKPHGFNLDKSLQDGSLTPQSFELLHNVLLGHRINCGSVADLGSEAGHAVAQFAFKPFVNQVIGIEIQYAWVAYSVIMMQHLQAESCKHDYYLADIHIIHGSFLDTTLSEWEAAMSRADLCFCNNVNWEKGAKARPVPQMQQSLTGEYRNSINANVANLLVDKMKLNSHVLVFNQASFANQAWFEPVQKTNLMATWSTLGGTPVHLLKIYPTHFRVLKQALKTLCQAKNCNFESLPRDWWEHEVPKNINGFLRLNNHILNQDYFEKSNASVHWGWNVTVPMIVCIKKFPDKFPHAQIENEIDMLNEVANSDEASKHSVIRFFGTDIDRKLGTVLIFEGVDASSFNSDLENMTAQNIVEYMYRLLQALNYLHKRDVVHRDVKPANFLHNFKSKTFRLIDFGSAEKGTQGFVRKGGGTRGFRAPEILIGEKKQTAAVDVWSAGIILLSLITGKRNILSRQEKQIKGNVCDAIHLKEIGCIVGNSEMREIGGLIDEYGDGIQHENKSGWEAIALQSAIPGRKWNNNDHALDLLSKMLKVQPSKRITPEDALNHAFLQSAVNRL
jgi:serine/threonine protein kinase